ncbi:MAG TPA: elongation factor P, partial [Bacteroidales bacterium]|nr:elongation factor P [Bacteroidales bacterium]
MATTADFRNGLVIEYNGELHTIVQFQHVKPGKGPAFVRTKLKNIKTGRVLDNTFPSGTRVNVARVERRPYQYLYKDEVGYYFMHVETFEQIHVHEELIDAHEFLKEGENVEVVYHADTDTVLSVEVPQFVVVEVTY